MREERRERPGASWKKKEKAVPIVGGRRDIYNAPAEGEKEISNNKGEEERKKKGGGGKPTRAPKARPNAANKDLGTASAHGSSGLLRLYQRKKKVEKGFGSKGGKKKGGGISRKYVGADSTSSQLGHKGEKRGVCIKERDLSTG